MGRGITGGAFMYKIGFRLKKSFGLGFVKLTDNIKNNLKISQLENLNNFINLELINPRLQHTYHNYDRINA